MTCHELKGLLPLLLLGAADADAQAHLDSCPSCRDALDALRAPKGSFALLAARLEAEPARCDDEAVTLAAYGEGSIHDCARCRDRVDQLRAVIARLDRFALRPLPAFLPPPAAGACDDEAATLAAYGDGVVHDCARCRDRVDLARGVIARLDMLRTIRSRATFATLRLAPRRVSWQIVAAAAAVVIVVLSPFFALPRPTPFTPLVPPDPLAWIDTAEAATIGLSQLPSLEMTATSAGPRAITAIRLLRDLGPAGEAVLIAALRSRPPASPAIAAALGSLRSRNAVPELIALATPAALRALVEIRDPESIPTFLAALNEPATADIAMDGLSRLPEADVIRWLELFKNGATPDEGGVLATSAQPFMRDTARWIAWRSAEHRQAVIDWATRDDAGLPFLIEASLDLAIGADALAALSTLAPDRVARAVEHALPSPAAAHVAAQLRLQVAATLARFPDDPDACRALAVLDPLRLLDAAMRGWGPANDALAIVPTDALRRIAAARRTPAAVEVLGRLRNPALFDWFVAMLSRACAPSIRALALLGDRRAVPRLIPLLSDPRFDAAALDALRDITGASLSRRADWERWWALNKKTT